MYVIKNRARAKPGPLTICGLFKNTDDCDENLSAEKTATLCTNAIRTGRVRYKCNY